MEKKRSLISLENLPPALMVNFREEYGNGYEHSKIIKINKGQCLIYALPFETEDTSYLIKVDNFFNDSHTSMEDSESDYYSNSGNDPDLDSAFLFSNSEFDGMNDFDLDD